MTDWEKVWLATYIIIPTANRFQYLQEIIKNSEMTPDRIIIVRTKPGNLISGAVNLFYSGDFNIHKWWNFGLAEVESRGGKYAFVLSDDISIEKGQLQRFLRFMIETNSCLVHGMNSGEGFWGHAFLLKLDSSIKPDERFIWWYGDFDLAKQAKARGKLGIMQEVIKHIHLGETTKENEWLTNQSQLDLETWYKKYPMERLLVYPRTLKRWIMLKTRKHDGLLVAL